MADNAMLSIFDTDGGFLDDLASDNGLWLLFNCTTKMM
jgi:hypothetical protein